MIAVLLKTLVQHGLAFLFGAALLFATLFISWTLVFAQEMPTLMTAGTGTLYYVGPLYILFVTDRLVATDRLDGTTEWLAALPMHAGHRLVLPFGIGLAVVAAVFETVLLATAVLASRREGLPLGWLLQLHVQVGLFGIAWYTMAWAVAHTGRYRWLVWWCVLNGAFAIDGSFVDRAWRSVMWTAPLADPVEHTRSVPPWDSALIVAAWVLFGIVLTLVLETRRGGELANRWYAPATARQRAAIVVAGMVVIGLSEIPDTVAPSADAWRTLAPLPAARADVRVAGRALEPVGHAVAARLDALGQTAGVARWPGVVLVPARRGLDRHVRVAAGDEDRRLVLMVDREGPRDLLVRDVVHRVLVRQTGDLGADVPGVDALLHGLAAVEDVERLAPLRVYARGTSYAEVRRNSGYDVAGAVAAEQIATGHLDDWIPTILGSARGSGVPAFVRLRWDAWGLAPAMADTWTGAPALPPPVVREEGGGVQAEVPADAGSLLEVAVLDPLQPAPLAFEDTRRLDPEGRVSIGLAVDPSQSWRVRATRLDPATGTWLASPWVP
jgi:hypothetical protein